jgi:sucrose-6-phosphate hydrolase SacC (GH32 family)
MKTIFVRACALVCVVVVIGGAATASQKPDKQMAQGKVAPKPLFRDPAHDGAADPVVIWNRRERKWFMIYTNRRANVAEATGVEWVHGTRLGVAESADGGATWKYRGTAKIGYGPADYTHWAPDVVWHNGLYHMFLTIVPGIFKDWNATREITHLTSADLLKWKYESTLKLASDKAIDASVFRLPDGSWRMWYNNERDKKSIYYADSPDLFKWEERGKAIGERGEGPKVFRWRNRYWMALDVWRGLALYSSDDLLKWTRQPKNILETPGQGADDKVKGGHADVVVSGERAFLFYFTHPGRQHPDSKEDGYEQRRSSIQVVELKFKDGEIIAERDQPTRIRLQPPDSKK